MDEIISLRISKELKERMRRIEYINWSAVIRKILLEKINELKDEDFDIKRARQASKMIDKLRESNAFKMGKKTGTEMIREWRNKRKF